MEDWKEVKLGKLGEVVTGKTPSKKNPQDWGENMMFITPTDYGNYRKYAFSSIRNLSDEGITRLNKKILPKNSVLVTCIGSQMGLVVMNSKNAITNQQINSIIPNEKIISNDFLYYRLVSLYELLRIYGGDGTAVPILNKGDFEKVETQIPSLPEQRAIASVLSSLDDKIDLLHRQNQTLEEMAETLFRQWFQPALKLRQAGVEEADEEWEEGKLGDLIDVKYGKAHSKLKDGEIPVYGSGGLMRHVDTVLYDKESVLIPRKGSLNNVMYINKPFWTVDTMFYSKMKRDKIAKFVFHFVNNLGLASMNVGSAVPSMTTKVLNSIPLKIPPQNILNEFDDIVSDYYRKKDLNKDQIQTLTNLRDTLLPKLMSGEVRVKKVEEIDTIKT